MDGTGRVIGGPVFIVMEQFASSNLIDGFASEVLVCNPAWQEYKLGPGLITNKSFTSGGMGFGYDRRTNK